jgi:pimeloyl-ACP methyl ester carboxylesterase
VVGGRAGVDVGAGPTVLFIHGSAADHTTWSIQTHASSALAGRYRLVAYDRRGPRGEALADAIVAATIEEHAADAAELCAAIARGPVVVVGSSFGAVVALELARRFPAWVRGAILCEPPLAAADAAPPIPAEFLERFDALVATEGGPAAGEYFLRTVLGDDSYARMPRMYQARSKALWRAIRSDCAALGAYRVRYRQLAAVTTPMLLVAGDRSAPYFRPTIEALAAALGRARVEVLAGAGHMMHADAHRAFAALVSSFCDGLGHR